MKKKKHKTFSQVATEEADRQYQLRMANEDAVKKSVNILYLYLLKLEKLKEYERMTICDTLKILNAPMYMHEPSNIQIINTLSQMPKTKDKKK